MATPTSKVGVTSDISQWKFQENYVERLMDNAAFTAAHPNNTLVLAGPARIESVTNWATDMLPLGMVQNLNVGHNRPTQPMQMLGSGRTFFLAGKGQVTFNIGRLFVNGRNLLRALYTQALADPTFDVGSFDESPVVGSKTDNFWLNLDSELFYIPFGMAVVFKSVSHDIVGAFYIELCMLNSWSTGLAAGQNLIMEQVSGVADRIRPVLAENITTSTAPTSATIIEDVLKQDPEPTPNLNNPPLR
jgi:hypothetical protein